jgi:para-nitrobenzyl esterase
MQTPSGWPTIDDAPGYSENCLTLNVYVPVASSNAACAASAMPVMVWLHGGDFQWGGHNDAEISSPPVTKASAHTIIVVPNYRLGAFGFLAADALRSRDVNGGSTGNYGLQDQRAAFAWARSNAASFGGDGGRITIYGESAGGGEGIGEGGGSGRFVGVWGSRRCGAAEGGGQLPARKVPVAAFV